MLGSSNRLGSGSNAKGWESGWARPVRMAAREGIGYAPLR